MHPDDFCDGNCEGQFYNPGENSPMVEGGCPNCGRPMRTAMYGMDSKEPYQMKNMTDGLIDQGGNPLKEGILADGGWQNRQKRDESFASVRRSWNEEMPPLDREKVPGEGQTICPHCLGKGVDPLHDGECPYCLGVGQGMPSDMSPTSTGLVDMPAEPFGEPKFGSYLPKPERLHPGTLNQEIYPALYSSEEKDPEVDFEVEEIVPPDLKSIDDKELKKEIKDKTASVLDTLKNLSPVNDIAQGVGDLAHGDVGGLAEIGTTLNPATEIAKWAWEHPHVAVPAMAGGALMATGVGAPEGAALEAGAAGAAVGEGAGAAAGEAGAAGAEAGASRGAIGGAANWMKGALKPGNIGNSARNYLAIHEVGDMANQGLGMGQPQAGGEAPPADPRTIQQIAQTKTAEDYDSPFTHGEIPKNQDGDSNVKSDGDNSKWQKDYSTGDEGGASRQNTLAVSFSPDSSDMYEMMFPLVAAYAMSEEDGSKDPLMQALHKLLEGEIPGYLDHADVGGDEHGHQPAERHDHTPRDQGDDPTEENKKEDHTDNTDSDFKQSNMPFGMMAPMPTQVPENNGAPPMQGRCIKCGGTVGADGKCAQCGAPTAAPPGHAGESLFQPGTPEQQTAIQQTSAFEPFMYEGEPDIPPDMDLNDYRRRRGPFSPHMTPCANCGALANEANDACPGCHMPLEHHARVAADHQGPHTPEQFAAVAQYLQQHGRGEEVPQMIMQPDQFAQELALISKNPNVPEDPLGGTPPPPAQEQAPPGETMPVPGMQVSQDPTMAMASVLDRYSADSVASKCPKCNGHTTRLVNQEDGTSHCQTCGNTFKTPNLMGDDGGSTDMVTTAADGHPANPMGVPAADQQHQEDHRKEQDSSLTWKDDSGQPLKVGQPYEMYSLNYDIPDIVRIEAVRPESIEYTIEGTYGLAANTKITFQEAQLEGLTFRPAGNDEQDPSNQDFDIEQNNDDNTDVNPQGSYEQSDLSSPHQMVGSVHADRDWLREDGDFLRTAGKQYTRMEQQGFIEEMGEARNADKMDLSGTHYEYEPDEDSFLFGL